MRVFGDCFMLAIMLGCVSPEPCFALFSEGAGGQAGDAGKLAIKVGFRLKACIHQYVGNGLVRGFCEAGIMKYRFLLLMLISPVALADTAHIHNFPKGTQGILSVEHLTQGKLLWLQGRVGEGSYTRVDGEGRHCTIRVPVVVGRVANTGLGIDAVEGLSIIVMNKQLSEALIKGERINSNEWQFVALAERRAADGYIVKGIAADEGFVLNSKRRWTSWLLDETPMQHCQ